MILGLKSVVMGLRQNFDDDTQRFPVGVPNGLDPGAGCENGFIPGPGATGGEAGKGFIEGGPGFGICWLAPPLGWVLLVFEIARSAEKFTTPAPRLMISSSSSGFPERCKADSIDICF